MFGSVYSLGCYTRDMGPNEGYRGFSKWNPNSLAACHPGKIT